nr:MAG TPA: hypothetical protein [Caudoviricetes sp.]
MLKLSFQCFLLHILLQSQYQKYLFFNQENLSLLLFRFYHQN